MNRPVRLARAVTAALLLTTLPSLAQQPITYRGQLNQSGSPFTGLADLEFRLYDAPTGSSPVATPIARPNWPVEDGLFQVELDFIPGPFGAGRRWLEVIVDGEPTGPREAVRPASITLAPARGPATSAWSVNGTATYGDGRRIGPDWGLVNPERSDRQQPADGCSSPASGAVAP
ncbi:hypothetical protein HFP89_12770 [Wenzhouxiangella sp. XN79A]|uniref:hypothetical protein n=1 Tax=Wenzhouxiangella sp. XN79A TaxID=2724193 RepID=UPI00144AE81F|nr:hypothetical protein [Wenzhouxiangella sp. XN79A]NKI36036.1 hypothetical protein [Wenzhouxiangella sp. XN79A]